MADVVQHKNFCWKPSFVDKKMDEETDSVSYLHKIQEITVTSNNKKASKFGMRLFNGQLQVQSCKISNMNVEILRRFMKIT